MRAFQTGLIPFLTDVRKPCPEVLASDRNDPPASTNVREKDTWRLFPDNVDPDEPVVRAHEDLREKFIGKSVDPSRCARKDHDGERFVGHTDEPQYYRSLVSVAARQL